LQAALETLVEPVSRGDPESPLRWTCKSTRRLAEELTSQHHPVSPRTVAALLVQAGYSLQANRKTREGLSHPDRNAQFEYLNEQVRRFLDRGQPAISVDTKKKESAYALGSCDSTMFR
jgi:elongation factor P hydroxylase